MFSFSFYLQSSWSMKSVKVKNSKSLRLILLYVVIQTAVVADGGNSFLQEQSTVINCLRLLRVKMVPAKFIARTPLFSHRNCPSSLALLHSCSDSSRSDEVVTLVTET